MYIYTHTYTYIYSYLSRFVMYKLIYNAVTFFQIHRDYFMPFKAFEKKKKKKRKKREITSIVDLNNLLIFTTMK